MLKSIFILTFLVVSNIANAGIRVYEPTIDTSKFEIKENGSYFVEIQNRYITLRNNKIIDTIDILKGMKPLAPLNKLLKPLNKEKQAEYNKYFYKTLESEFGVSKFALKDVVYNNFLTIFRNGKNLFIFMPEYRYEGSDVYNFEGNIFYTYPLTEEFHGRFNLNFEFANSANNTLEIRKYEDGEER